MGGAPRRSYNRIELILGVPNVVVEEIGRCSSMYKQTTRPLTQQVKLLASRPTAGPAASVMETDLSRRPHPGVDRLELRKIDTYFYLCRTLHRPVGGMVDGRCYSLAVFVLRLHSPILLVHASVPLVQTQPRISVLVFGGRRIQPPSTLPSNTRHPSQPMRACSWRDDDQVSGARVTPCGCKETGGSYRTVAIL